MSAATLSRSSSAPHGFDRLALDLGLALVAWSRRRTARRVRMHVQGTEAPLTSRERSARMHDPYSSQAVHSHGVPPGILR
ncbi:hypothetical protein [Frondihabitans cladoniiphilus]|uniref:Uncharacterized protein n=1 Tax=Frondihabitans cladoniiphilus TaxID=715785 RepID=A0ABP8VRM4_9MICO